jgi:hypothetical protein
VFIDGKEREGILLTGRREKDLSVIGRRKNGAFRSFCLQNGERTELLVTERKENRAFSDGKRGEQIV